MLRIHSSVYLALCHLCEQDPVKESCGLLGGQMEESMGSAKQLYHVSNVADEPEHRYVMSPYEMKRAFEEMRKWGQQWVGQFHSHPTTAAVPSALDRKESALLDEGIYYLIYSVRDHRLHAYRTRSGDLAQVQWEII